MSDAQAIIITKKKSKSEYFAEFAALQSIVCNHFSFFTAYELSFAQLFSFIFTMYCSNSTFNAFHKFHSNDEWIAIAMARTFHSKIKVLVFIEYFKFHEKKKTKLLIALQSFCLRNNMWRFKMDPIHMNALLFCLTLFRIKWTKDDPLLKINTMLKMASVGGWINHNWYWKTSDYPQSYNQNDTFHQCHFKPI